MLTACRKVARMYRPSRGKSSVEVPDLSRVLDIDRGHETQKSVAKAAFSRFLDRHGGRRSRRGLSPLRAGRPPPEGCRARITCPVLTFSRICRLFPAGLALAGPAHSRIGLLPLGDGPGFVGIHLLVHADAIRAHDIRARTFVTIVANSLVDLLEIVLVHRLGQCTSRRD